MMMTLAHISDLHATRPTPGGPGELLGKRAHGLLSWVVRRRKEHRPEVVEALLEDLAETAPDHLAVTGDLTQIGLPAEFRQAAEWLERLGPPSRVTLVPGNHDAYADCDEAREWRPWAPYLVSRGDGEAPPAADAAVSFPSLHVRGRLALVGLSSARPTAPLLATGRIGPEQREAARDALRKLQGRGLFRVVLIHHPPTDVGMTRRRQLDDAEALAAVLAETGAELVLHGHTHRTTVSRIDGPDGPIPVMGVPSASAVGRRGDQRRARYHLYRIEPGADGFRVRREVRAWQAEAGRWGHESESELAALLA